MTESVKIVTQENLAKAYFTGKLARAKGFERVSPYYECEPLDHYFFAGWDGKSWEQANA